MNRKLAIKIKDYLIITFGLLLFALGWLIFLIPVEITGGGIRGVTVFDGKDWYTRKNTKIIMSVIQKKETSQIFRKIREIDPDAFITIVSVMRIFGKGFYRIKL